MTNLDSVMQAIFSPYVSDPKWYPFILIGIALLALLIIYMIFMYIRSFISWIFGVNELISLEKENNRLIRELVAIQDEQNQMIEEILMGNADEGDFLEDIDEDIDPNDEIHTTSTNDTPESMEHHEIISTESEDADDNEEIIVEKKTTKKKWFSNKK